MTDQEKFHYTLPEDETPSRWGGLSQAAREAVADSASGPAPADELLGGNEEAAVRSPGLPRREVVPWASAQVNSAIHKWNRHDSIWHKDGAKSADEVAMGHHRYNDVILKLFNASEAFYASGKTDPAGDNIGDGMELVLLPWRELQDNLSSLESWIGDLWGQERISGGYISPYVISLLQANLPIYRTPGVSTDLLRPDEYLQHKIESDGDWGIMLTQTEGLAGVQGLEDFSPDDLAGDHGSGRFLINGYPVDMMGIFEWICLRLQQEPNGPLADDNSWLLANFVNEPSDGPSRVLRGKWHKDWVQIDHGLSDDKDDSVSPRLAIL